MRVSSLPAQREDRLLFMKKYFLQDVSLQARLEVLRDKRGETEENPTPPGAAEEEGAAVVRGEGQFQMHLPFGS